MTVEPGDAQASHERLERVEALERAIAKHPAYLEHHAIRALAESFGGVYLANLAELDALLRRPIEDDGLALELIQNTKAPTVRNVYSAQLLRALHNYLASTQSLVDHVRRVMRGREGDSADEFKTRRLAAAEEPAVRFFQDLRNFTLHRALPPLRYEVRIQSPAQDGSLECDVGLSISDLRKWDRWAVASRRLLEGAGETLVLPPLVSRHSVQVIDLNRWLLSRLAADNAPGLAEVNELIVEQEAVATGLDRAAVRQRIQERSTRVDYPS